MLIKDSFDADKSIAWLVRGYETYHFNAAAESDKFMPRPYVDLVFHFKHCPEIATNPPIKLEPFFVAPVVPKAFNLKFEGEMDTLAISCNATVFSRVFAIDLSPVSKRSIILPGAVFQPLWQDMANCTTVSQRLTYFSNFIHSVQPSVYSPDPVDVLYAKIIEKSITTSLKEILQECPASKSTLLRKFAARTGVRPKTLARIVRLDYLWTKIRDAKAIDYQNLVFDGNYFDQSHFINDFKTMIGETPGHFFNRNLSIVKMFSGNSIHNN